ncbi:MULTISPECIES: hypothetical protein [Rhodobacterales]|uniref:Uncharacterized protein n=1 Tax=Psychromarinibacter halotolerans TaxID=1775175 RepID=A0ABV7GIA7_9RHOB|nr:MULTISPECIES: hypothetical protein [Rhodobacterales]
MLDLLHELEVFPTVIGLKRIDPAVNMRRFYRMSVQSDPGGRGHLKQCRRRPDAAEPSRPDLGERGHRHCLG